MTDAQRITELERLLKVAQYDAQFLQSRLDAIRKMKDRLIHLLETPTLTERLDAIGEDPDEAAVMDAIMGTGG